MPETLAMARRNSRIAFTLLECVVVLAIVGICAGLLLAAIQRVRSAAVRAACANNLRQLGIALHQYHGANSHLPAGVRHPAMRPGLPPLYGPDDDPYPLSTWLSRLLPFVNEGALWEQMRSAYSQDRYALNTPPHMAATALVRLYFCPADTRRSQPGKSPAESPGPTSYLGVEGTATGLHDGLLFLDSRVRFADIQDGASHTLLAGERPPGVTMEHGRWYGGWATWHTANVTLPVRATAELDPGVPCLNSPYTFGPARVQDICAVYHFWSLHPGGAHFLVADGAVRFLPYSAAPLLPAHASRAGGEPVGWPGE